LIGNLQVPARPIDKPLRLNITNFYESTAGKLKGHCISGKIEGNKKPIFRGSLKEVG
jgi:translation elongation factor EF-1alpha